MLPVIVFPLHDPEGQIFSHLEIILPDLKTVFVQAVVGVTPVTLEKQPGQIQALKQDGFFKVLHTPKAAVGAQFSDLYRRAASMSQPDQILHLCFVDRLAFILQSSYKSKFIQDVQQVGPGEAPMLFTRSDTAWMSHPQNYYAIEQFATRAGQYLFCKSLDFAWCHLAVQASQLGEIMPGVTTQDLSLLAEMVLFLGEAIKVKEVDWLAWEDPFLLSREALDLKSERENSVVETQKRLAYIIPTLQALLRYSQNRT